MELDRIHTLQRRLRDNIKKAYVARRTDGVLLRNVANLGAEVGTNCRITRGGEYEGLTVEVGGSLLPLITDEVMGRVLLSLKKEAVVTAMDLLHTNSVDDMLDLIDEWFAAATMDYKRVRTSQCWSHRTQDIHAPLAASVRLVSLVPSIPEEWAGRLFSSAQQLHDEWSAARGGPPVTYAVTYGMEVLERETSIEYDEVKATVVYLVDGASYKTSNTAVEGYQYVVYDDLAVGWRNLFAPMTPRNTIGVARLVSQLQKCVRVGPPAANLLVEVIVQLAMSPDYYVPERNFERVTACRCLAWRGYISILEDAGPLVGVEYLLLLTLVCSKVPGHFNEVVLEKVSELLLESLTISNVGWRDAEEGDPQGHYAVALRHIPMMSGDNAMLRRYSTIHEVEVKGSLPDLVPNAEVEEDVVLRSIDPHCCPFVILLAQACDPLIPVDKMSRHIWNTSSSYNYRYSSPIPTDTELRHIQRWVADGCSKKTSAPPLEVEEDEVALTTHEARQAFISLFGQTYKVGKKRVCYAASEGAMVKTLGGTTWEDEPAIDMPPRTVKTKHLPLPLGYVWTKTKYTVSVKGGVALVDGAPVPWYDATELVKRLTLTTVEDEDSLALATAVLTLDPTPWSVYEYMLQHSSAPIDLSSIPVDLDLACLLLMKLEEGGGVVQVGPVDRSGVATLGAVHNKLEGRVWGAMCLFSYLYPGVVTMRSHLAWLVERHGPLAAGYAHLVGTLRAIVNKQPGRVGRGTLKTKLWAHQKNSVDRITSMYERGAFGAGDAGNVGSGKTLTALTVGMKLPDKMLVLVNSPVLLGTWTGEVEKHTTLEYRLQQSNGVWVGPVDAPVWISTLARVRDHPPSERWSLLVIDECLSVQNNKAQWTAEAWRQSVFADHVLMLSATFFRSRYDKLYFMLKMLRSGLPAERSYLDAILIDCMLCQQPANTRTWQVTNHSIPVSASVLQQQRLILDSNQTAEAKYSKISSLLLHVDVTEALKSVMTGAKCLIYARSNQEAELWSKKLSVPIYPDTSQDHVIVTLSRGTYGLNDLVKYTTLITRPPEPDRLPQMKGRLDRPGQLSDQLNLVFFYLEHTIEEGGLKRLDVARQFDRHYKMPLSKYYELSLEV